MSPSSLATLAFLLALLSISLAADHRGKRRRDSGGRSQHPLRAATGYGDSRATRRGRNGGHVSRGPARRSGRPEDDGAGWGRRPAWAEAGPPGGAGLRDNRLMGTRKGRGYGHGDHSQIRRHGGRRDKGRHGRGFFAGVIPDDPPPPSSSASLGDGSSPNFTTFGSGSSSMVALVTDDHSPTLPPSTTRPQRAKGQGEVLPTLDMALFDWTDYEDIKPVDGWPSSRKKEKMRSKNLSSGNATNDADDVEPCDHHLDCLPGSCCDLRQHECKAHNRGLNNKCYDDCMCEEGFRCYAKFHRKRRVTRRRGRCVAPDSVSSDHGGFITV
ncbi:draxin [Corythoichthys intestinalis]|uniref:draxin n=1 Tax=Corythoichthys intestinalis TaxID=161448 RepID=UPI0025A61EC1|nr:draxin [Corythoichthys intestinalis]XP_061814230.1 draxin-A-like [Nerophis lumbriciformis]